MCPQDTPPTPCKVYVTAFGEAHGASLDGLKPVARASLQELADASGHDLGINATTNGQHRDRRHNGTSISRPERNNPNISGTAVDIGEIGNVTVRTAASDAVADVMDAALGTPDTKTVLGPTALYDSRGYGYAKTEYTNTATQREHAGHFHISFFIDSEK